MTPLDPLSAGRAGRPHGQIASTLGDGGLVLSSQKLVEIGARALLLIAPGIFRFDARPQADSLQVMTRALGSVAPRWAALENPPSAYGDPAGAVSATPYRATWRFEVGGPRPLIGHVLLLTTLDRAAGLRHFTCHAVVRDAVGGGVDG